MFEIFINVLAGAGTLCTLMGLFVFVKTLVLPKREPMDTSNRINHLRLVWFTLNAPHESVNLYFKEGDEFKPAFPWLRRDEGDNVDGIG